MQRPQLTPPREPSLLHRIAAGEVFAKAEFTRLHAPFLWAMARRFVGAQAEQAVNDIFLEIWRAAAAFDPTSVSEPVFVALIARRRLTDHRRTRGQHSLRSVPDPLRVADQTGQDPDSSAEASRAARALRELAPELRSAVVLATCHDMSHTEVAAHTGVSLRTVKARMLSGLRSIRSAVLGVSKRSREQP